MEKTITISSNRIYLNTLPENQKSSLLTTRDVFSAAKEELYNHEYNRIYKNSGENDTDFQYIKGWIKKEYSLEPLAYHITSICRCVKGMIASQRELLKMQNADKQEAIKNREEKIAKLEARLKSFEKSKKSLIKFTKTGQGKITIPKYFEKRYKNKPLQTDGEERYLFEVELDKATKRLKGNIAQMKEKNRVQEAKIDKIPPRITFGGGKSNYKKKDTTNIDHDIWKEERDFKRKNAIMLAGRFDSKNKNWLVEYIPAIKRMSIRMITGDIITFPEVCFPYRGDELEKILMNGKAVAGCSVGYWIQFKKDKNGDVYILIKASFTVSCECTPKNKEYIGIDINADNIAWTQIDSMGKFVHCGTIPFNIEHMSSGRITDTLGRVSSKIISLCRNNHVSLAMENLDFKHKKAQMAYKDKKKNKTLSSFAYKKIIDLLEGKALRNEISVVKVNPAYTSIIGKYKYKKTMRQSVHIAASYVIARKAAKYKEKIPKEFKNIIALDEDIKKAGYIQKWKYINKKLYKKAI